MSWSDYSFRPHEWLGFGGKQATVKPEGVPTAIRVPQTAPLESAASLANRRIRVVDPAGGKESYNYLTHNLEPRQLARIEETISNVSDEQIDTLMQSINRRDYKALEKFDSTYFHYRASQLDLFYPYIALAAVKKGKMSEAEFSTVMFYWSLRGRLASREIQILPLFNEDGTPNQAVKDAILQTCHLPKTSAVYLIGLERKPFATPEQIDLFFERARDLPPSQQCIFVTQDHLISSEHSAPDPSRSVYAQRGERIIRQVRYSASFNFFDQFTSRGDQQHGFYKGANLEMMGSFGAYQTMGQVLFGENCVAIRPVIGLSTVEEIQENGRTDERDLGLPFPFIELPKSADLFSCETPAEFIRHDIGYHFWVTSQVPSKHRKAIEAIAEEVKQVAEDPSLPKDCKRYLDEFYERLIDMEFPSYRPDLKGADDPSVEFILALNVLLTLTAGRIYLQRGALAGSILFPNAPKSAAHASGQIVFEFAKHKILQRIAERIYDQRERFKEEFGIDLFNQETLSKANDESIAQVRLLVPEKYRGAFGYVEPLAKLYLRFAGSYISLPQILMDLRAKRQFDEHVGLEQLLYIR